MKDFAAAFGFVGETCTSLYYADSSASLFSVGPRPRDCALGLGVLATFVTPPFFAYHRVMSGAARKANTMAFCAKSVKFNNYELLDLWNRRSLESEATPEDLSAVRLHCCNPWFFHTIPPRTPPFDAGWSPRGRDPASHVCLVGIASCTVRTGHYRAAQDHCGAKRAPGGHRGAAPGEGAAAVNVGGEARLALRFFVVEHINPMFMNVLFCG
jgi:hypothetical protein